MVLENNVSPLHFLHRAIRSRNRRDLTRRSLVFPTYEERFASFSVGVHSRRIERPRVPHIAAAPALGSITDLGIKSTAGRCRHSQYGSSRCGLVIARTRIDVCPDDLAI